jgi:hypothetical protein
MKLARNLSLRAVQRLGELMESEDDRVVAVACNSILDRAFGKPKASGEEKDDLVARLEAMAPEQRVEEARKLLEEGKKYLPAYREWARRRRREG